MITRRGFLKAAAIAGAGAALSPRSSLIRDLRAQIAGGTLPPNGVNKFVLPLVKPPAMPISSSNKNRDLYRIAVRQFQQRILPAPYQLTTVWSYGSINYPGTVLQGGTFNYPAFTIEATWGRATEVAWKNDLIDANGNYLPHLLPVDQTLHWANPPGGQARRDSHPMLMSTPGPYTGPVPLVTHVHGAHTTEDSDGHAEGWFLPAANNIPAGYATTGTFFDYFNRKYKHNWGPGAVTFKYPNDQRAATLWYHDHTLGMTRLNVYAGPAGFYLLRGGPDDAVTGTLPGPAPGVGADPFGDYGEIPIAIQDRSFNADASLFYPDSREFFDGFTGPYAPNTPVAPIWNPEFFGNMIVVNGRTWPFLDVEPKRYRFRFLNGCNARFLLLKLTTTPRGDNSSFNQPEGSFWQIGSEGGFLPQPVQLSQVLMSPAERADIIIDFSQFAAGEEVYLVNDGPDSPFGGITTDDISDWESTGLVMKFVVGTAVNDPSTPPNALVLPTITPLGSATPTRHVSLNEEVYDVADIPFEALLGTFDPGTGDPSPKLWSDPITENPALNATEEWKIYNFTEDAHPIHVHEVQFQLVGRQPIDGGTSEAGSNSPLPTETGFKDTVIAYPDEITTIKAFFDLPGFYVWHCHIVEHEDNEMMRPYCVGPIPKDAPLK